MSSSITTKSEGHSLKILYPLLVAEASLVPSSTEGTSEDTATEVAATNGITSRRASSSFSRSPAD